MPAFLGVPVDAAYHLVSALAALLAPLPGGLAAAAAIVLITMAVRLILLPLSYRAMRGLQAQARLAPQVQALRKKHAGQPERLQRELAGLYRAEGTTMLAGCLPALAQWPVLSVLYLLFRSPIIAGSQNALLARHLLGAPLGAHWLGGPGPLSAQGAVFAGLFVLLSVIGWASSRIARRQHAAAAAAPAAGHAPPAASGRATAAVTALAPYVTVVITAFVPLAAGVYLLTTACWTAAERTLIGRVRPSGRSAVRTGRNGAHP